MVWIRGRFLFSVDVRERTARGIWKSPEQRDREVDGTWPAKHEQKQRGRAMGLGVGMRTKRVWAKEALGTCDTEGAWGERVLWCANRHPR